MISPLVRRKRLGAELLRLRKESKLPTATICKKTGLTTAKISRMENATFAPNLADLMTLLPVYGVDGTRWHEIIRIAADGAERGWWQDFGKHMGARQRINADLEFGAALIREFSGGVIPGLLQTADYTRARCRVSHVRGSFAPTANIDKAVEARLARQRMMRRPEGPRYTAVIDELALLRPAAPPETMRAQIEELIHLQETDSQITIHVLPIRAVISDYWLPNASFSIYTYSDPQDPTITVIEGEARDLLLSEQSDIDTYQDLFTRISDAVLSPESTTRLMRQITAAL
ncbi:helix-turn-helix domain-containing protein [Stackebrandtia soli]|uniref:helix-turn-helix domain-containing protein n=1 Tax=Stackebrandtia soli TaxID=1892856 RepID=UPI0039EB6D4D